MHTRHLDEYRRRFPQAMRLVWKSGYCPHEILADSSHSFTMIVIVVERENIAYFSRLEIASTNNSFWNWSFVLVIMDFIPLIQKLRSSLLRRLP